MRKRNTFKEDIEQVKTGRFANVLTAILAVLVAGLFLSSLVKCHYSPLSGSHCHGSIDLPHIHPFANH